MTQAAEPIFPPHEISAVVLAGGLSTRFGQPKAGVSWQGKSLLQHVLDALPPDRAETILVCREEQKHQAWPVDQITFDDPELPEGPARGIVSGLRASTSPWNLVVACDLPRVQPSLLRRLSEVAKPTDLAVIPVWQDRYQPLCALYAAGAGPEIEKALGKGERSLQVILRTLGVRELSAEACAEVDPQGLSFYNVNDPQALEAIPAI